MHDAYVVGAAIAATVMLSALVVAALVAGPPVVEGGNRADSPGAGDRGTEKRVARERESPRGPDTPARPSGVATELLPLEPWGGAAIAGTAPRSEVPPSPLSQWPTPGPAAVVVPSGASSEPPPPPPESTPQADDPPTPPDDPAPPPDDPVPPPGDPAPPPDDPAPPPDDPPVPATTELSAESLQGQAVVPAPLDSTGPL